MEADGRPEHCFVFDMSSLGEVYPVTHRQRSMSVETKQNKPPGIIYILSRRHLSSSLASQLIRYPNDIVMSRPAPNTQTLIYFSLWLDLPNLWVRGECQAWYIGRPTAFKGARCVDREANLLADFNSPPFIFEFALHFLCLHLILQTHSWLWMITSSFLGVLSANQRCQRGIDELERRGRRTRAHAAWGVGWRNGSVVIIDNAPLFKHVHRRQKGGWALDTYRHHLEIPCFRWQIRCCFYCRWEVRLQNVKLNRNRLFNVSLDRLAWDSLIYMVME